MWATQTIPLTRLKSACPEPLAIVKRQWPNGIPITRAAARTAAELGLDLDWAANEFLTAAALTEYEQAGAAAWAEYQRVTAPARTEYERVQAPARTEYEQVRAPAWAKYERAAAAAWAEYQRVTAPARTEYERVQAPARTEYERFKADKLFELLENSKNRKTTGD